MKVIIGVCGLIGSGKDEVANALVEHRGFTRIAFGDALKEEIIKNLHRTMSAYVNKVYGLLYADDKINDLLYKNKDEFSRCLLQEYGTEIRRGDDPNYWVRKFVDRAIKHDKVVVPDVRFDTEYECILSAPVDKAYIIKVHRPLLKAAQRSDHVSEHLAMRKDIPWSAHFINDETIDSLKIKVLDWYDSMVLGMEPAL